MLNNWNAMGLIGTVSSINTFAFIIFLFLYGGKEITTIYLYEHKVAVTSDNTFTFIL